MLRRISLRKAVTASPGVAASWRTEQGRHDRLARMTGSWAISGIAFALVGEGHSKTDSTILPVEGRLGRFQWRGAGFACQCKMLGSLHRLSRRWKKQPPQETDLAWLRQENARLRQENAMLKEAFHNSFLARPYPYSGDESETEVLFELRRHATGDASDASPTPLAVQTVNVSAKAEKIPTGTERSTTASHPELTRHSH